MDSFKIVKIETPYITLGQLLKFEKVVGNGGEVKYFLQTHEILVNGEPDNRRGRKLYPGDKVSLEGLKFEIGQ